MQSVLAHCRYVLSRRRGLRALWLLTVLGLLVTSVPRWELHQHVRVDDNHAHAVLAHDHHRDAVAHADVDNDVTVSHFHSMPSFSIALIEATLPSLERRSASADAFASPESTPVTSCWPPPHRPPIA